jgi:hypothetical protein
LIGLGINGNWYLTGQGEMYAEGSNAHDGSTPNQDKELEEEARKIQAMFDRGLIKINRGSENGAQSVDQRATTKHHRGIAQESAITIPVYFHAVAAGKP